MDFEAEMYIQSVFTTHDYDEMNWMVKKRDFQKVMFLSHEEETWYQLAIRKHRKGTFNCLFTARKIMLLL